jgi:hypothetical protein
MYFNSTDKQIYSYLHGFAWNTVNNLDMNVLTIFQENMKTIICSNDESIYNYMIYWFAFIAQNPGKKNKTAFIIIGEFGSGKNTLTDTFIKLFKRYSKNFQRLDSPVGKFNSAVENRIFGVLNELAVLNTRILIILTR